MRMLLQHKIFVGYFFSVAIIGIMVAILLYEQSRIKEIAANSVEINDIRQNVTVAHREITELATLGESVIGWDEEDCRAYRTQRLRLDSLLLALRRECVRFVRPEQVDTLRMLLAAKETHLLRIMRSVRQREEMDSLIAHRLPTAVASAAKPRIEVRRKKGIAGFFGKKDTIRVFPPSNNLHALNNQINTLRGTPTFDFNNPVDSLRRQNRQLNRELSALISLLDGQVQKSFDFREKRIADMRQTSFRILSCVLGVAILLLALSYIIIQRDLRRREAGERKLKEIIGQNRDLLDMRKKIILTISHDIRAPLSIINGSAELAMGTRDRKRRNSHLTNIGVLCKHILHLLNNLLDVYRLNEAKETRNDTPFRLSDLLERIAAGFTRRRQRQRASLSVRFRGHGRYGLRRQRPHRADRGQPALERRQVHRGGKRRLHRPLRKRDAPADRRRYGYRHERGNGGTHLRPVRAFGSRHECRRFRLGAVHHERAGRAVGRGDCRRQRSRQGQHVPRVAPPAADGRNGGERGTNA